MGTNGVEEENEHEDEDEDEDASVSMDTGIYGQTLGINGWFASHADTGRPGPHVHLHAYSSSAMKGAVLKTSQIPELIDRLNLVAERIDRRWERDGDEFLRTSFGADPDPNDPEVIRQGHIDQLVLNEKLAAHITEIVDLVVRAEDIHEATDAIAALLGVNDMAVQIHLLNFSLFGLTRDTRAAHTKQLQELRQQP